MPERPPDSPPIHSPDGATPPSAWDVTLLRAIDAGQLDASQAADAKLAGAFAAHQKLESLFAALRGELDAAPNTQHEPAPTQLGRYVIGAGAGSAGAAHSSPGSAILGDGAFGTLYLAYDPDLNRDVAIKVSSRSLGKTARARAGAIATEARHAASPQPSGHRDHPRRRPRWRAALYRHAIHPRPNAGAPRISGISFCSLGTP